MSLLYSKIECTPADWEPDGKSIIIHNNSINKYDCLEAI